MNKIIVFTVLKLHPYKMLQMEINFRNLNLKNLISHYQQKITSIKAKFQ